MFIYYHTIRIQSCNKFVNIFQETCYEQADIRMRSYGLRQLVDNEFQLFQVVNILVACDCQNLLSTALLQVDSTNCNKSANDRLQQA